MAGEGRRGWGWYLLAGVSGVLFVTTALWALIAFFSKVTEPGAWLKILVAAGPALLFWWWICMGALRRAKEPRGERLATGPDSTDPDSTAPRTGPWGYVGWVLTVLVLGGLAVMLLWSTIEDRRHDDRVEDLASDVRRSVSAHPITVDDVRDAQATYLAETWEQDSEGARDPLDQLVPVAGTDVLVLAASDDRAVLCVTRLDHDDTAVRVVVAGGTNPDITPAGRGCR